MAVKGYVNSVESFGSVDGPGVRFVFFMQGCSMRCKYCHNPETWECRGGQEMTAEEGIRQALRYKNYWGDKGGITVSGGEALLQIDFVTELFTLAKENGINTALDTSANPFTREEPFFSKFKKLMDVTDLFILDIKEMDEDRHKKLTGFTNKNILDFANFISENDKHMWIRKVLVPGVTDQEDDLIALRDFVKSLKNVDRFEVLPYHTLGLAKWKKLGIPYSLDGVNPPTKEELARANELLETASYTGHLA